MKELEKILMEDKKIEEIVKKLNKDKLYSEVVRSFKELNDYLFKNYCIKGYLEICEPEYCTYRINDNCDYIKLLGLISQKYKIDIINKRIK